MKEVNKYILKAIETILKNKLANIYYDKTFPSTIFKINENGTYKVSREGNLYDVPCGLGIELKVGQSVWVTMPCGNKNIKDMYISGIRGEVIK